MESSQPPSERTCPSCSAPAEPKQRWCLECGHELPQSRRPALRSAVGIATTLTVLVGAASAGGYTLLQDGKEPPPPTQTIAQTPPPVTTPPETQVPPVDDTLPTTPTAPSLPNAGRGGGGTNGTGGDATGGGTVTPVAPPVDSSVPDLSDDLDTSSPPPPPPDDDTELDDDGSVREDPGSDDGQDRAERQPRPRLVVANLAISMPAIAYAPYAEGYPDLGEPGLVTDGSTRTVWRSPRFEDPALQPQMGVYVELASAERIRRLVLSTPTPGMSVEIYASRRDNPPPSITAPGWAHLADRTNVPETATIPLAGTGRWKYVLVWIRSLAPGTDRAEISEIELIGLAPE